MSLKIVAWREWPMDRVALTILDKFENGSGVAYAEPIQMRAVDPRDEHRAINPTCYLSMHAAQELMDRLWECGLRPAEGTGSAGALAATQKHLEDMRGIAFHKLGMDEPKGK
jgi:hypothetical protein